MFVPISWENFSFIRIQKSKLSIYVANSFKQVTFLVHNHHLWLCETYSEENSDLIILFAENIIEYMCAEQKVENQHNYFGKLFSSIY